MTVRYCVYRDAAGAIDYLVSANSKGHGRDGYIAAEGSCFSRSVTLNIGGQQITVNEGSLIDFINANRRCGLKTKRKLSKGFLCFGPSEAKIQKRFVETVGQLSNLPQGSKNHFQSEEWGYAQAKLDLADGKYQAAYEHLKNVRDPRGIALRNIIMSGTDLAQDLYRFAEYLSGCIPQDSAEKQENLKESFEYYRLAANAGSIQGCLKGSRCLEEGIGIAVDLVRAEKAAKAAESLMKTPMPIKKAPLLPLFKPSKSTTHFFKSTQWHYEQGITAFEAKNYADACIYLEGATDDKRAEFLLNLLKGPIFPHHGDLLCQFGDFVSQAGKYNKAFRYYKLAAEAGWVKAYSELERCFRNSYGTSQDLVLTSDMKIRFDYLMATYPTNTFTHLSVAAIQAQSLIWAAKQGIVLSAPLHVNSAAWHYAQGKTAFEACQYDTAKTHLKQAPKYPGSAWLLDILTKSQIKSAEEHAELLYTFGCKLDVLKDEKEAFRYYMLAAEAGWIPAYEEVSRCLALGLGTARDPQGAGTMTIQSRYFGPLRSSNYTALSMNQVKAQSEIWARDKGIAHFKVNEYDHAREYLPYVQGERALKLLEIMQNPASDHTDNLYHFGAWLEAMGNQHPHQKDLYHQEAFEYYTLAEKRKGLANARTALERCHTHGIGTPIDLVKAAHWKKRAQTPGFSFSKPV